MENISIQRATNVIADWYVAALPAKDPQKPYLDAQNQEHRNVEMNRVSYNLQVGAFNLTTIGLVATVALAVIGTITLQMGLVLAGLFLLIRHDVMGTLADYAIPADASRDEAGELAMFKMFGLALQTEKGITAILKNLKFHPDVHPEIEEWKPVALQAFGHIAWMSLLPNKSIVTELQHEYGENQARRAERLAPVNLQQNDEHHYAWVNSNTSVKIEG